MFSGIHAFSDANNGACPLVAEWAHFDGAFGFKEAESINGANRDIITLAAVALPVRLSDEGISS